MSSGDEIAFRIRVCTRPELGGGHLARMRTLARQLQRHGPVTFIVDDGSTSARATLTAEGYRAVESQQGGPASPGIAIVDHPRLDDDARAYFAGDDPLVVIDDTGRPDIVADLVVNSGFGFAGGALGRSPALLGPEYALIDPRYADAARPVADEVQEIVLTFGLRDPDNVTGKALTGALQATRAVPDVSITVVMGSGAPHLREVEDLVAANRDCCRLRIDEPEMVSVVAAADLVVGAGGVSLFERAAAGTPSITVSITEDHRYFCEKAGEAGVTRYLGIGNGGDVTADDFGAAVTALSAMPGDRCTMAQLGRASVDGRGAARTADAIAQLAASRANTPAPAIMKSAP